MSNKSKGCLVVLVAMLAVIIIAFAMCDGGGGEKLPENLTAEEAFVAEIVGYETNHSEEEYKVKLFDVTNHGTALDISLIGNDNLSADFIKRGMWRDSAKLFEVVFDEYPDLDSVYIYWQFPLVDQMGNENLREVLRIGMHRETAEAVNWDNFQVDNFPDVADSYWQHPVLE